MGGTIKAERLCALEDEVGECAVWDNRSGHLLWIDIAGRRIHRLDPETGTHQSWATPEIVTSIGLCAGDGAVVGLRKTVTFWNFGSRFEPLSIVEPGIEDNRLNEARVAPDGSFWVGTMQNNLADDGRALPITRASGGFFRVEADGKIERLVQKSFGICNTMAWTDDGHFLCADTLANALFRFRLSDGHLVDGRPFGEPFERGLPDGSALDAEGCLWNCRVGGGCIVRFDPDGAVDRVIDLPCSAPTSCTFGGSDMRTLFVTSARFGLDAHRRAHPDEGALFALRPGPRGVSEHRFARPIAAYSSSRDRAFSS